MSFVFTDTPGSTLPKVNEPIDGAADREIVDVRVVYNEEKVYSKADGFVSPYSASSLADEGKALSIVRAGGWPPGLFTVYVEERQQTLRTVLKSTSYAVVAFDLVVVDATVAGTKTLTLPAPSSALIDGLPIVVQKLGTAANVVLSGAIDGEASLLLDKSPERVALQYSSEDSEWQVVAHEIPPTPIPTGAQTWGAIYSVDLTDQDSQSLATAGSYTLDDKTWWMKGTLWGDGACELVNGAGLRLFAPATLVSGSQPNRPNFRTSLSGILQRVVTFNPNQLADYNPAAPLYVEWRMSGTISSNSDRCYSAGLMSAAGSSAPITDGERATCAQVCHHTFNNGNPIFCGAGGSQAPNSPNNNNSALSAYRTGVQRFASDRFYVIHKLSASDISPESALDLSGLNAMMQPAAQTPADLSFYFTLHKAFSDGATLDVYLTHLRVLQPKVPA